MTNWVEYWDKDRELVRVIGSYVPVKGEFIKLKLKNNFKMRKVIDVVHKIDKTDPIKEKFLVFLE